MAGRPPRTARRLGPLLAALLALVVVVVGAVVAVQRLVASGPVAGEPRCVATAGGRSTAVTLEQAANAAVIVGVSVRRGLPARAASIALATAYQETDIRNLTYGDRDSVGLFQQRPSQGWGDAEEILDPHFASGAFYDALVRVPDWQDRDITEVAQEVQRSAYPDAYRDHEADARTLASALSGRSAAAFTCLQRREPAAGDPDGLRESLRRTFGRVEVTVADRVLTVRAPSRAAAWAYAHYAVAAADEFGVAAVRCREQVWTAGPVTLPAWQTAAEGQRGSTVTVELR